MTTSSFVLLIGFFLHGCIFCTVWTRTEVIHKCKNKEEEAKMEVVVYFFEWKTAD
jgi:hypothetical protein